MPPLQSFVKGICFDNEGDRRNYWTAGLGFSSPLFESISKSKSKLQNWVDHEKSKMDSRAESYLESLAEHEAMIKKEAAELAIIQKERGIDNEVFEDENGRLDNNADIDHPQNIAAQKKVLEKQIANVQIEIIELKTERDNRGKRVHGKIQNHQRCLYIYI